ncbi:AAA family ATPase [Spirulina major CS-329]|uniref:AAA family ATPase n=1 Tax=Spirulina TaxID=1154 RepID=UPI0023303767|nr:MULTISPECIES: AAA family ATPase [Spirulina]MDB9496947.1 AAA family ATPase [Spirulina subsalsa CS-330]MDB9504400.1 AAA family ATPase [Spirulina major CS-329]
MTTADDIFDQSSNSIERLGLREIPFTESPIDLLDAGSETLNHVFTGREHELRQVFNLFQSRERRRILVYGRLGIGKSAFLLEVLSVLRRKRPKMLTTYVSLPANLDIATTALIAIAQELPDNEWAQRQLHQMGIPTAKPLKDRSSEVGGSMGIMGKISEQNLPTTNLQYPTFALDTLLEQAHKAYPDGIVIAIDDLDKQEPRKVSELLHDAQGVLKGRAWFMLTGHPIGMTSDLLTSERGLFDLQLPLTELDEDTTYQMLINYLSSARIGDVYDDPDDRRAILPFLPDAARHFCQASLGKPRLFNRLGRHILATAADLGAETITLDILNQGLRAAEMDMLQQAALTFQEERVRELLLNRGNLSDEDMTYEELQELGVASFGELLPILERLETEDLAYQIAQDDVQAFAPIPLAPLEEE